MYWSVHAIHGIMKAIVQKAGKSVLMIYVSDAMAAGHSVLNKVLCSSTHVAAAAAAVAAAGAAVKAVSCTGH